MSTPVAVTISRQFGAGGARIGRQLAGRLGYRYLDQEILRRVAAQVRQETEALAGREERLSTLWDTMLRIFGMGAPDAIYPPPSLCRLVSDRDLFELEGEVIGEVAARENAVIVGRGGFRVLKDHPRLVSIFLYAGRNFRAETIRRLYGLASIREALDWVENCDRERERYLKTMTGVEWMAFKNFQLCLDTGRVSDAAAIDMIVRLVDDAGARQH
jgi:cytidylate kinase